MSERPKCEGRVIRTYGSYLCSQFAVFAVKSYGEEIWRGACGHHLSQVVTEMSNEHGPRLTVIHLNHVGNGS